ncbi:MAG: alpha/beta hydrolase [Pseudomonadota bacterium]
MPKIKIGDAHLFFDIYGSNLKIEQQQCQEKPSLLILHGAHGIVDHSLYVAFWSQFADIAQVIFLDQRGCGRSDYRSANEWSLQQWGQDVYDFCDALSIDKPIVAGVSMGGHVICEYASRYPQHPGGIIFCNTEAKLDVDAIADKYGELGGAEVAAIYRQNFFSPTAETARQYKAHCVPLFAKNAYTQEQINRCVQRPEILAHYNQHELQTMNYLDKLATIACPTLFMVGEKSPGHPPKSAKDAATRIKPELVTYHEFNNAGAPVYNDAPDEAYQVVRQFVKELSD